MVEEIKPVGTVCSWEEPNLVQCYPLSLLDPVPGIVCQTKAQKEPTGAVQSRAQK